MELHEPLLYVEQCVLYKVEQLNDYGDWILKSWHHNREYADMVCQVCEEAGKRARIVKDGRVIYESPFEGK